MRLSLGIVLVVGVAALGVWADKASSSQAAEMFGNATYRTGNEHMSWVATLVNGVHDEPYLHVRYDNRYVYGDFNGDGLQDAAVILTENNGGNAEWYRLAFLINDGATLVHRASRALDDRAIINSMRAKNGQVWIDMFVHQEGDCRAGPTKRVRNAYAYEGPDRWGAVEKSSFQRIYAEGAKALQEIYGTPIPAQIRKTFDRTTQTHEACSAEGCAFTGIFTKKFIVVDCGPDGSGGMVATLVFDGTDVPFLLWMDDRGGGRYELHRMTETPGLLGDGFVHQLQSPDYRRYWL